MAIITFPTPGRDKTIRHLGYKRITHLLKGNAAAGARALMKVGAAKTQLRRECVAPRAPKRVQAIKIPRATRRASPPRHFFFNQFNQRTPADWLLTHEF